MKIILMTDYILAPYTSNYPVWSLISSEASRKRIFKHSFLLDLLREHVRVYRAVRVLTVLFRCERCVFPRLCVSASLGVVERDAAFAARVEGARANAGRCRVGEGRPAISVS